MKLLAALLAFILSMTATAASAAVLVYTGTFTGAAEAPPVVTPASGNAVVTIDTSLNSMRVEFDFVNLIGDNVAAHIHCCTPPGSNAGVATAVPTFPGFPFMTNFGSYDQTFDLLDAATYNPAFVMANGGTVAGAMAALLAGLAAGDAYGNIHTKAFPGGEIRANLTLIPLPGAFVLFGAGLAGFGFARRRASRRV